MHKRFKRYMKDHHEKLLNAKPKNFVVRALQQVPIFADVEGFVKYERSPQAVDPTDDDAFNIVFIGPTGCGKSSLINRCFNTKVSKSTGLPESVTRDIMFFIGSALLARAPSDLMPDWHLETRKVNIVDTIGLCDSTLPNDVVQKMIKQKNQWELGPY